MTQSYTCLQADCSVFSSSMSDFTLLQAAVRPESSGSTMHRTLWQNRGSTLVRACCAGDAAAAGRLAGRLPALGGRRAGPARRQGLHTSPAQPAAARCAASLETWHMMLVSSKLFFGPQAYTSLYTRSCSHCSTKFHDDALLT